LRILLYIIKIYLVSCKLPTVAFAYVRSVIQNRRDLVQTTGKSCYIYINYHYFISIISFKGSLHIAQFFFVFLWAQQPVGSKLTSQLYLIWLRPYFHLTIYLGPWSVFSAVSVLTAQLSMSSLNIYHQFMLFRDSLPKVRFTRSPLAKRIKFKINLCFCFFLTTKVIITKVIILIFI